MGLPEPERAPREPREGGDRPRREGGERGGERRERREGGSERRAPAAEKEDEADLNELPPFLSGGN